MSAIHTLPTAKLSFVVTRIVSRLELGGTTVVLSTFMIAFPAGLMNASPLDAACSAFKKLRCVKQKRKKVTMTRSESEQGWIRHSASLDAHILRVAVGEVVNC